MALILDEEQQLLKDSAKAFLSENFPVSALRAMRDAGEDHMPDLWSQMSDMGWPGMVVPDAYSGLEFGYVGAGVVLEEMGRTLALSPFLSSAVVAATLINKLGNEQQKETLLPSIASGELTAVLAADESGHYNLHDLATEAKASDFPNSDRVMKNGVLLPVHHGMTEEMFGRLHDTINEFVRQH